MTNHVYEVCRLFRLPKENACFQDTTSEPGRTLMDTYTLARYFSRFDFTFISKVLPCPPMSQPASIVT